jgi:TIR domain-containing protein
MTGSDVSKRVIVSASSSQTNYTYYESGLICVRVQNQLDEPILVDSVSLSFQQEPGTDVVAFGDAISTKSVKSGGSSKPLNVRFEVRLSLRPSSNFYQVVVKYRLLSLPDDMREAVSPPGSFMIIEEIPPSGNQVFLSHCMPEDSGLAQKLGVYLRHAGFTAYMAEIDDRVGTVYWEEKLEPEILKSIGMVVLWTPKVELRSDAVGREIRYAQDHDVSTYPLLEMGPTSIESYPGFFKLFPREELEHLRFDPAGPVPALIRLVDQIERELEEGKFPPAVQPGPPLHSPD